MKGTHVQSNSLSIKSAVASLFAVGMLVTGGFVADATVGANSPTDDGVSPYYKCVCGSGSQQPGGIPPIPPGPRKYN